MATRTNGTERATPTTASTGDDVEFYRVTETADGDGEAARPAARATARRMVGAPDRRSQREFEAAGLPEPRIFEFPHYCRLRRAPIGRPPPVRVRWERATYFSGVLTGRPARYDRSEGQFFPYVVRDVYGTKVLPENLGSIAPSTWHSYKARGPEDLVRAAQANLVVRDGFAAFYFHPFLDLDLLKQTIEGIEALGYKFVDPASL